MPDPLRSAIEEFYEEQEHNGSRPTTFAFYRCDVENFLRDMGIVSLVEFVEEVVRRRLVSRRHLSAATSAPSHCTSGSGRL